MKSHSYWSDIWKSYWSQKTAVIGSIILFIFLFIALYAPIFASSKPLVVKYDGSWYFPVFHYYLSPLFFTKNIDLFFNFLGLIAPLILLFYYIQKKCKWFAYIVVIKKLFIIVGFIAFIFIIQPANEKHLNIEKQIEMNLFFKPQKELSRPVRPPYPFPSFAFEQKFRDDYAKLSELLDALLIKLQHERIVQGLEKNGDGRPPYTLYSVSEEHQESQKVQLEKLIEEGASGYQKQKSEEEDLRALQSRQALTAQQVDTLQILTEKNEEYEELRCRLQYLVDKRNWILTESKKITFMMMPLIRPLHWEDDAGGDQALNVKLPFIELSRINRKDLMSALIFGVRISLFVGLMATALALCIGIPLGLIAGFYGGKMDIVLCRLVEVWESMPAFFMLLLIVTLMQTKSIFLIIFVIAIFSWPHIFRFVRAETFRQREIPYIDSCHALGFSDLRILFNHLLPNCIVSVIALLPFDMMSAITQEAGLAFLGLGEEQSCSWGVLMDEGRAAFPAESALLWPPAIALTLLLIAIALVGDALHNAMDPKSKK